MIVEICPLLQEMLLYVVVHINMKSTRVLLVKLSNLNEWKHGSVRQARDRIY